MSSAGVMSGSARSAGWPISRSYRSTSTLLSRVTLRRTASMARCLAVAVSQAAGLSGTPGPLLKRNNERILGQVLSQADIAHDAGDRGDDLGRLDAPDGLDLAVDI